MRNKWMISGLVQGVGFRVWALGEGRRLGLSGWVRNLPDGRVTVEAEGAESEMKMFADLLRRGPSGARVQSCDAVEAGNDVLDNLFSIRRAHGIYPCARRVST